MDDPKIIEGTLTVPPSDEEQTVSWTIREVPNSPDANPDSEDSGTSS